MAAACGALAALPIGPGPSASARPATDRISTPTLPTSTRYQPDLTDAEATRAVTIARSSTPASTSAAESIGRAILAYPPDAEEPFFVNRIVYVTFHASELADPSSGTWVDLTSGGVVGEWSDSTEVARPATGDASVGRTIGLLGQPGPRVQWGGWSMTTEVSANEEGLALRDLRFGGHLVATKLSMPVMTVVYEGGLCGPFADRIGRPLLDIDWADGQSMVYRELTIDGMKWRELGVRNQIGDYDLYQSYLFSPTGVVEAQLSGSGLQCLADHEHFPTFYLHTDIDGGQNDRVAPVGGAVTTNELDAAVGGGWQVADPTTRTRLELGPARIVVPGPSSGGTPVVDGQRLGARRYRPAEDAGWRWGARTSFLPYDDAEALGGDVAIWYQARMGHQASDGADHWHTTGIRLTVTAEGAALGMVTELNDAAVATNSTKNGALRG